MWGRRTEILIGLWLAGSPLLLPQSSGSGFLFAHDLACGTGIVVVSILTSLPELRRLHLLFLPLAAWLVGAGWWYDFAAGSGFEPVYQNWMVVGLTLAMVAVVPTGASTPPDSWRRLLHTCR